MTKNTSKKIFYLTLVVIACFVLPQITIKEDETRKEQIFGVWKKFDNALLEQSIDKGETVFVSISADWCLTCKYNEFTVLNRSKTLKLLRDNNIHAMHGDITNHNPILQKYMMAKGAVGVPYYRIYGPSAKDGIEMPVLISYSDIEKAIIKVNRGKK